MATSYEVLIYEQGTIIDRIDYNIQNVAASVEEGYKQLQRVCSRAPSFSLEFKPYFRMLNMYFGFPIELILQAERTQRKGGMVMCATILVIMCFVMLVLLILKTILF